MTESKKSNDRGTKTKSERGVGDKNKNKSEICINRTKYNECMCVIQCMYTWLFYIGVGINTKLNDKREREGALYENICIN
jgi:hypothetical protein